jgi:uncharacterized protein with PQ loop repeat
MNLNVFGLLAAISSLTIVMIGLPSQIYKNWKNKTCGGIDIYLIGSVAITYFLWSVYGWTKPDLFLACSQTPGFLLSLIILAQFFIYRKKGRS